MSDQQNTEETVIAKMRKFVPSKKVIIATATAVTVGVVVVVVAKLNADDSVEAGEISDPPFELNA